MNVITVSREYGAGGGEVARRLAEALGWQLLDRELLHQAAEIEHVPDAELERMDEQAIRLMDRLSFRPAHKRYLHGLTEAVRQAAARGNVVLVGRGTRQILGGAPGAFHLRLVAPQPWRIERMARHEGWSFAEAQGRCREVDRTRERFNSYFFGDDVSRPEQYDLVVNTARVPLVNVVELVRAAVANDWPTATRVEPRRVLSLSRELGAGESDFAAAIGRRLHLRVCDREVLEQAAGRLGVTAAELDQIDERPSGDYLRWEADTLPERYHRALGGRMRELAKEGGVLLLGRGASRFLRDHPSAFHVRLVAPLPARVRRVMDERSLKEEEASRLISDGDRRRGNFHLAFFGADWADPLEYHLIANTGRLGARAADAVASAAEQHWSEH